MPTNFNLGNGWNWNPTAWQFLSTTPLPGAALALYENLSNPRYFAFNLVSSTYSAMFGDLSTLTRVGMTFVLAEPDGTVKVFNDLSVANRPGGFVSQTSPGGTLTQVTQQSSTQILQVTRSNQSTTTTETITYTYDANANLTSCSLASTIAGVTQNVSQALYAYYDGTTANGNVGDLMSVTRQLWQSSAWNTASTEYYRYYTPATVGGSGFTHGLRFVCLPQAYLDLTTAYGNPNSVSDATLATFADYYFTYDSNQRVTQETVKSGSMTFSFAYSQNPNQTGSSSSSSSGGNAFNTWVYKTVETRPDNSTNTVYSNTYGMAMLTVLKPSASSSSGSSSSGPGGWCTFFRYDNTGNEILGAEPSAVTGYSELASDLLQYNSATGRFAYLNNTFGLIRLTNYYSSADSPQPAGYRKNEQIQQGQTGAPILVQSWQYTTRTAGGTTTYPVSTITQYPSTSATPTIVTSYAYTFYTGSVQVQQQTTTLPVISTGQNGSGVANMRKSYFDMYGNEIWSMDERGFITGMSYDIQTGAVLQQIDDYNTAQVGNSAPSGWTTPSGGGLNLITDYTIDNQGRTIQTLAPTNTVDIAGTATTLRTANWTVYDDVNFITYSGQGYATGPAPSYTYKLINPVSITMMGPDGRVNERIKATSANTTGSLATIIANGGGGTNTFPQTNYVRWTTIQHTDCCLAATRRVYKLIPASGVGTSGVNYDQTSYGYDYMKRPNRTVTPGGTITDLVYETRGLLLSTWIGTNDAGATVTDPSGGGASGNNMVLVTANIYDNGLLGGDGNLTRQTQWVDASTSRVTSMTYDFRNRMITTDGEIDYFEKMTYDNLDRVTMSQRYNTTAAGNLIGQTATNYDNLSRAYQSIVYAVDPATGTVGNSLTSNTWFDASGNVIKSFPAGSKLFTKSKFDSLGRQTFTYAAYGSDTTYADASSVAANTVMEQQETSYDANSNAIQTTTRQRYHNAPATQLGALQTPTATPNARVTYMAMFPDALGRPVSLANYGTNGGTALSRPATAPARSDTVLVSSTTYDAAGDVLTTTDPAGLVTLFAYDSAGRRVRITENCVNMGSSSSSTSSGSSSSPTGSCTASDDMNRITLLTYTADGLQSTLVALNARTGPQTTTYTYGTTLSNSAIASSILLSSIAYPDSTAGSGSSSGSSSGVGSDVVSYTYNRQGQKVTMTDQRGCVHSYLYDLLGRPTNDCVTTLPASVDGTVRRFGFSYEVRGLMSKLTSYDNAVAGSGSIVNDVALTYNAFGQIVSDAQSHSGVVVPGTTPQVQYAYANGSTNTIRPTTLTYPNGRAITIGYGTTGGINDSVSRVDGLIDGATTLVNYAYLGLGVAVQTTYPQPSTQYTLFGSSAGNSPAGDIYWGLDRFGRIIDSRWFNTGASTDIDRIKYGYDRASNRIWRQNPVATATGAQFDEFYTNDGLHRLKDMQRGTLNGTNSGITSPTLKQCWTLDATGNWRGFNESTTGSSWTTVQSRTSNPANEITNITNTVGSSWVTPAYDAAGNMTTIPVGQGATAGWAELSTDGWAALNVDDWASLPVSGTTDTYKATYDAWNRLVKIDDAGSGQTIQQNQYDARTFRTVIQTYANGALSETRHSYFSSGWRCVEERIGVSMVADRQFVWGGRYIDDLVCRDRTSERLYALQDANWNVTSIVNTIGVIQERYAYSAYGQPKSLTGAFGQRTASNFGWETLFCGYRYDASTGHYLARARFLSSEVGSWLNRDPLGYFDEMNLYGYVLRSPLTSVDPSGLATAAGCPDGWEQHHWFPQQEIESFKSKCGTIVAAFNALTGAISAITTGWNGEWIHLFTTCVEGKAKVPGTQHYKLHSNKEFGYNAKVKNILDEVERNNGDCCSLLMKMLELMDNAWAYVWNNTPGASSIPSMSSRKYRSDNQWTKELLGQLLDFACNPKNRSPSRCTKQASPGRTWVGSFGGTAGDATEKTLIRGSYVAWGVAGFTGTTALILGTGGIGSVTIFGGGTTATATVTSSAATGGVLSTPQAAAALTTLAL